VKDNRTKVNQKMSLSLLAFLLIFSVKNNAQNQYLDIFSTETERSSELSNTLSTDPFLPLFKSFALIYEHRIDRKNSFVAGFWYGKVTATYPKEIPYPGYARNYAPIVAYRRYFWKNLHAEGQFYPGYTAYFEDNSEKARHSFSLFSEIRLGYYFNFTIKKLPLQLNLQWPVGTTLYESNEPDSFREIRKQDPVFYLFFPNFYLGYRF
jgi:hypothetical protein